MRPPKDTITKATDVGARHTPRPRIIPPDSCELPRIPHRRRWIWTTTIATTLELLDELSIGWCRRISDDGLELLSAQPNRSASIVTLRLARCSITDRGVLNALALLKNLEELDLNGCVRITGAALGTTSRPATRSPNSTPR